MKTFFTALLLFPGIASVEGAAKNDFVPMFDGETLKAWEATPAKIAPAWTVQDGMIVGNGDKGRGYLTYTANKNVADLELKFSYRFPGKGNSGVNIRAIPDKTHRREHRCFRGDRLVIAENDQPAITPIKNALTAADIRKGDWNHVHIIVEGNRFQLFINGKLSSEFTEHLPQAKRLQSGMIQLQLHDPGMIVQFRDLQLKVLK